MGEVHKWLKYFQHSFCLPLQWPSNNRDNLKAKVTCWAPTLLSSLPSSLWLRGSLAFSSAANLPLWGLQWCPKAVPNPQVYLCCFSQLSRISPHSSWGCFHPPRLVEPHNTCQQQLCPFQDRPKDTEEGILSQSMLWAPTASPAQISAQFYRGRDAK